MDNASPYEPAFLQRYWAKVSKHGPVPEYRPDLDPCWIWTAAKTKNGYGQIGSGGHRGKTLYAHRVSYELHCGALPEDRSYHLDHLCRTPACVNPGHLELVTCSENVQRGLAPLRNQERARRQTHCVNGHEFTPENTYIRAGSTAQRNCRTCALERYHAKNAKPSNT